LIALTANMDDVGRYHERTIVLAAYCAFMANKECASVYSRGATAAVAFGVGFEAFSYKLDCQ